MTNDRAAEIMKAIIFMLNNEYYSDEVEEAIHMAINALTAQEQLANNSPKLDSENGELISNKRTEKRTETHSCDLISRKAAIECLEHLSACDEPFVEIGTGDETFIGKYEAITEISDLPSAQPKHDISKANFLCPICGVEMEVAVSEWEGGNE